MDRIEVSAKDQNPNLRSPTLGFHFKRHRAGGNRPFALHQAAPWLLSLALVAGCSTIDPHVTWARPNEVPSGVVEQLEILKKAHEKKLIDDNEWSQKRQAVVGQALKGTITLQDGIDYAHRGIDAYTEAVGDQAILTNALAIGLIPLSAAALGLGVTGTSPDAITAIGLTGAAGFGAGAWLSSKPRQRVYLAGVKALTCAIDAIQPLNFSATQRERLSTALKGGGADGTVGLDAAISKIPALQKSVNHRIADLEAAVPDDAMTDLRRRGGTLETLAKDVEALIKDGQETVKASKKQLQDARATRDAGTKLDFELSRSGSILVNAVDDIAAKVNEMLVNEQPQLQALPNIINGLADLSAQFGPPAEPETPSEAEGETPEPSAPSDEAKRPLIGTGTPAEKAVNKLDQPVAKLRDALTRLKQAMEALTQAELAVVPFVKAVSGTKPLETLESCGVQDIAANLVVKPAGDIELKASTEQTVRRVVTGGTAPYQAQLLEAPIMGLDVEMVISSPVLMIKSTTNIAADGPYTIFVTDATGRDTSLKIKVK